MYTWASLRCVKIPSWFYTVQHLSPLMGHPGRFQPSRTWDSGSSPPARAVGHRSPATTPMPSRRRLCVSWSIHSNHLNGEEKRRTTLVDVFRLVTVDLTGKHSRDKTNAPRCSADGDINGENPACGATRWCNSVLTYNCLKTIDHLTVMFSLFLLSN